jgi:hypothetical protein
MPQGLGGILEIGQEYGREAENQTGDYRYFNANQ